jgi:hypothetical protein
VPIGEAICYQIGKNVQNVRLLNTDPENFLHNTENTRSKGVLVRQVVATPKTE